jgi:acyl-CoA thioesterase-1
MDASVLFRAEGRMDHGSPHGLRSARAAVVILAALTMAGCADPGVQLPGSEPTPTASAVRPYSPHAPFGYTSISPTQLPLGARYLNPASGRQEVMIGSLAKTAVLIGDSQAQPADSWVRKGLEQAGYTVYVAGWGGTGFSVGTSKVHDYADALRLGDWLIPYGDPALVVVQGGGNDASRNSPDSAIVDGAQTVVSELRESYPTSKVLVVGTLAKSAADGGGRRTQVDALLGRTATSMGLPFIGCGDWISRYGLAQDLADGVHLTPAGRARLAPFFAQTLKDRGLALG